jgi:hypothetical protein
VGTIDEFLQEGMKQTWQSPLQVFDIEVLKDLCKIQK